MTENRKLAAILASDVVGYSRMAAADEDRILARLRALRSDLVDPTIAVHNGRMVKRTGDRAIVEFRSVIDAVKCAMEMRSNAPWRFRPRWSTATPACSPTRESSFVSASMSAT